VAAAAAAGTAAAGSPRDAILADADTDLAALLLGFLLSCHLRSVATSIPLNSKKCASFIFLMTP